MIKAIFLDIDGTLLSHTQNKVLDSTKVALNSLKEKGIYIFVATGRHESEIKELPLDDLHFDGYITLNGQCCYNEKEMIYDLPICHEDVVALLDYLKIDPFPCIFIEQEKMYINFVNDVVKRVQESISTSIPLICDLNRGRTHSIYQIVTYGIGECQIQKLLSFMPHCKMTRWHENAVDLLPIKGGKKNGIMKFFEYYNIKPDECMAFGDGQNDIDMFGCVKYSVAMGNAEESVKKAASYVCEDCDSDGIYNTLIRYGVL